MTDFDNAETVGMGLRIPLSDEDAQSGFERVVVLGIKASWDETTTATRLGQLFEAHHYTDSLAFVGQNISTNNSAEISSGYRSIGRDAAETLRIELGPSLVQPGSDGDVTAKALGLPASIFAHVRGADGAEQRQAADMNSAVLALCDSALLRHLSGVTSAEFLREHFTRFVRARGPFPALRIDTQPYGVLPVAALDRWMSKTAGDAESALAAWWRTQRQIRRQSAPRALHTLTEENPVVLLAQEGTSSGYTMREFPEALGRRPFLAISRLAALRNLLFDRALAAPHDPALDALRDASGVDPPDVARRSDGPGHVPRSMPGAHPWRPDDSPRCGRRPLRASGSARMAGWNMCAAPRRRKPCQRRRRESRASHSLRSEQRLCPRTLAWLMPPPPQCSEAATCLKNRIMPRVKSHSPWTCPPSACIGPSGCSTASARVNR